MSPISSTTRPAHPPTSKTTPVAASRQPHLPRSMSGSAASRSIPRILTRAPTSSGTSFGLGLNGGTGTGRRKTDGLQEVKVEEEQRDTSSSITGGLGGSIGVVEKGSRRYSGRQRDQLGILHPATLDGSTSQPALAHGLVDSDVLVDIFPQHPPSFAPFFTLIHDLSGLNVRGGTAAEDGRTYHACKVRYLFSDDDVGELVEAAARCVGGDVEEQGVDEEPGMEQKGFNESTTASSSENSNGVRAVMKKKDKISQDHKSTKRNGAGKTRAKREERVIVVDIAPSGDAVTKASSMSKSWQLVNADLVGAPMWGGGEAGEKSEKRRSLIENETSGGAGAGVEEGGKRALMLRLEGVSVNRESNRTTDGGERRAAGDEEEDTDEDEVEDEGVPERELTEEQLRILLDGFEREMDVLRSVVCHSKRVQEGDMHEGGVEEEDDRAEMQVGNVDSPAI